MERWRLFWMPDTSSGISTVSPPPGRRNGIYAPKALRLIPRRELSLPDTESAGREVDASSLTMEGLHAYLELVEDTVEGATGLHQVGGHARWSQSDGRLDAQLATHGIEAGGAQVYRTPEAQQLLASATDWCLLWQVDSTDVGFTLEGHWLHLLIRHEDLAARTFERAWVIIQ